MGRETLRTMHVGATSATLAADDVGPMTAAPAINAPASASAPARNGGQFAGAQSPQVVHVHSRGTRWRMVRAGQGPRLLLLHGTGSACGSWLRLAELLLPSFEVLAPDLPGHGGSEPLASGRAGLDEFAQALSALLDDLHAPPDLIVGHSAGAAIGARIALDRRCGRIPVVSLNGALRPLTGWTAAAFVPLARLMGLNPLLPGAVAMLVAADPRSVRRLLDSTGSQVDEGMVALYDSLMRNPSHVAGTLRMLSCWDLRDLVADLPRLGARLTLVAGLEDRTVAPRHAHWAHARVPGSALVSLPGLGHMAHEEAPQAVARVVLSSVAAGASSVRLSLCEPGRP
jgi:magnesium chelatase accessory protein